MSAAELRVPEPKAPLRGFPAPPLERPVLIANLGEVDGDYAMAVAEALKAKFNDVVEPLIGADKHGAELEESESPAIESAPLLRVEHRAL